MCIQGRRVNCSDHGFMTMAVLDCTDVHYLTLKTILSKSYNRVKVQNNPFESPLLLPQFMFSPKLIVCLI